MHLLCCALIIAFNLVLLDSVDHIKIEVFSSLYIMSSETATNFIFCFLSEHITTCLSKIPNVFYGSLWYHLPPPRQKLISLAIARSQQEFHLEGLGIMSCSLETFGRVMCVLFSLVVRKMIVFLVHSTDCEIRLHILFDVPQILMGA